MDIQMGSHAFRDVEVPVLWGTRAILQNAPGAITIMDLSGDEARLEILAGKPGPDTEFRPSSDGYIIVRDGEDLYSFNPERNEITGITVRLPTCRITDTEIRVGGSVFSGNVVHGFAVGIAIAESGIAMGAPLPDKLAKLRI